MDDSYSPDPMDQYSSSEQLNSTDYKYKRKLRKLKKSIEDLVFVSKPLL